jgi:hypothetical protein
MKTRFLMGFILSLVTFTSLATQAQTQNSVEEEIRGAPGIRTWIRKNSHNQPTSLGFTASADVLDQIASSTDDSHPPEVVLGFPRRSDVPFTHLYLVWEPHGHDPVEIYGVPHWDVHFYVMSNQERELITCTGADEARCLKQPAASAIPSNYGPTPAGVPKMGWHWLDLLSPEFHGHPFTTTMVMGYYDGRLAFYEPMIAKSYLDKKPQFAAQIRQPMVYPRSGYFPNAYSVKYLAPMDEYEIALTHLVYRH